MQEWRRRAYGDQDAEEWSIGRTPPEIRQRYDDEMAILDSPTSSESDYVDNHKVPVETNLMAEKKPQHCDAHCWVSSQTSKVPYTPPSSSEGRCSPSEGQASQPRFVQPVESAPTEHTPTIRAERRYRSRLKRQHPGNSRHGCVMKSFAWPVARPDKPIRSFLSLPHRITTSG
jgi:hypothetical protein